MIFYCFLYYLHLIQLSKGSSADVKQRKNIIKEKSRFNKMLFYVWKKLEEEYGEDVIIFDEMVAARAGPIPIHLGDDIKELQDYFTKKLNL